MAGVEEELYVTFAACDGGWDDFDDLPVEAGDAVRDFFNGEFVDFGVADDSASADVAPAGFELGFDEDHDFCERGCGGEDGSEKERCGDEGDIHDKQGEPGLAGFSERVGGEEAGVGALDETNARVVAEFHGDLAEAGVDRGYMRGTALQKAIGEAAGGSAYVETGSAGDVDLPVVEGGLNFESAAADVGHVVAEETDGGIRCDGDAGLVNFLFVDEDATGKDEGAGALATLDEAAVNKEDIDAGFDDGDQGLSRFKDQDALHERWLGGADFVKAGRYATEWLPVTYNTGLWEQIFHCKRITWRASHQIFASIELSRRYFCCKDLAAGRKAERQLTESLDMIRLQG